MPTIMVGATLGGALGLAAREVVPDSWQDDGEPHALSLVVR